LRTGSIMIAWTEILLLMLFQWTIVYVYGPFLLREPQDRTKLILRACAGLSVPSILWLQAHIYFTNFSPGYQPSRNFIASVLALQCAVGLILRFRAAFKARRTEVP
jgi:hypothetical protein